MSALGADIEKIKTVKGRKWNCWSSRDSKEILEKILNVFNEKEIYINPALQTGFSLNVIAPPPWQGKQSLNNFEEKHKV